VTENEQNRVFNEWLRGYKALIFKIVRAYTKDLMEGDDLFQEITIQLWRSVPKFRGESAVTTWIYRVALNIAIRWTGKEKKHRHSEDLNHRQHILEEKNSLTDERLAWLYEEIHKLTEIDRSIALLLLDNFSYKEMADILGITQSNVGVKINRIKKHLISKSKKYTYNGI
jgi:RNA polymerase sigma-70 factor, ECF subfamily